MTEPGDVIERFPYSSGGLAALGGAILAGSGSTLVQMAETIARAHHERWDGSGYPDGLRGEAIALSARICALCDVVDALLSERSYKPAWPLPDVLAEVAAQRGRQFDPRSARSSASSRSRRSPRRPRPGRG